MSEFAEIEKKWQQRWKESGIFRVKEDHDKKKYYCLEMYPYPSGKLHMGHLRNYSIGDSFARYKRMNGFNVLYPMGYDSFGLPAENAAIKNQSHPEDWTTKMIAQMREQQEQLGLSYDWDRMVSSIDEEYYRWDQWIFLKMLEKGLAYRKEPPINWCEKCHTVLANEQVINSSCWRCESKVQVKNLEQWFFKITGYAEELLSDIKKLEGWPERVKLMQENWIGRSEGTLINFKLKRTGEIMPIFTTRVDTLWGVTFMVFAPEHPKVMELVKGTEYEERVKRFIDRIVIQDKFQRTDDTKEKEGMFIGEYAINPVTGDEVPIYIANFVLLEYGTGFIMAVPAHDQRDFEFAKKYQVPIKVVISPDTHELHPARMAVAFIEDGKIINSDEAFNGVPNREVIPEIQKWLEKKGLGKKTVQYKLRDWLISRQRFWGTPIPVIYCDHCGIVPVPEKELPVRLPRKAKFSGQGNPLASNEEFVTCFCPVCKSPARRETDTMDTFVNSSWYFLRYTDNKNQKQIFDRDKARYWMPVDQYIGGIEHAVLHLLYARFYTKFLRDMGIAVVDEPFTNLLCQGMVIKDGKKMSKSLGNVVDPGEIIEKYSADTARVFMLFAAMPEKELEWNDKGVEGSFRFLKRVYHLVEENMEGHAKELSNKDRFIISKMHSTIGKVTMHIEKMHFSLAIGELMQYTSAVYKYKEGTINKEVYDECAATLALLISPFAPHLAEEMWEKLGKKGFISIAHWPKADLSKIDKKAEAGEEIVSSVTADIIKVQELAKIKQAKKITLIIAAEWKYDFIRELKDRMESTRDLSVILKEIMATELKRYGEEIVKAVPSFIKDPSKLPEEVLDQQTESNLLQDNKETLAQEFKAEIIILKAEESREGKAKNAYPGKPAILIE